MINDRATKRAEELLKQTKEKFLASADPYQTLQDLLAAELREYGAQVREEAANQVKELLIHPSSDSPDWMALADQMLEGAIDAIRKMELP